MGEKKIELISDSQEEKKIHIGLEKYRGALSLVKVGDYSRSLIGSEIRTLNTRQGAGWLSFSSGRHCIRLAQRHLKIPEFPVPYGHHGPDWPDGWAGSISHSRFLAAGILVEKSVGVGLDIEKCDRLQPKLVKRIATKSERSRYAIGVSFDWTLVFSVKEAIFKAINPIVKNYIGFQDVEVFLNFSEKTFSTSYLGSSLDGEVFERASGYWSRLEDHFLSLVIID